MTDWHSALRNPSARKRIEAVKALIRSEHPHAIEYLRDAYRDEIDPDVKATIKKAASYIRSLNDPTSDLGKQSNLVEKITWKQVWSKAILFALLTFMLILIVGVVGVFTDSGRESVDTFARDAGELVEDPYTTGLTIILGVMCFTSGILGLFMIPFYFISNLVIHLPATLIFKGKATYKELAYYLGNYWIWAVVIVGFGTYVTSVSQASFFENPIAMQVYKTGIPLALGTWFAFKVRQIYKFSIWHGIGTMLTAQILTILLNQLI